LRRLGFWPPAEGIDAEIAIAEREVARLDREIAPLRARLSEVQTQISRAKDVESALDATRRNRIERVKREREARLIRQANEKVGRAQEWKHRRANRPQFLGRGVSQGLQFEGGDAAQIARLGLPHLTSVDEIARAIGIEARQVTWLSFHRGASTIDHYHRFQIPKSAAECATCLRRKRDFA
jgi:hypothetical protein